MRQSTHQLNFFLEFGTRFFVVRFEFLHSDGLSDENCGRVYLSFPLGPPDLAKATSTNAFTPLDIRLVDRPVLAFL